MSSFKGQLMPVPFFRSISEDCVRFPEDERFYICIFFFSKVDSSTSAQFSISIFSLSVIIQI